MRGRSIYPFTVVNLKEKKKEYRIIGRIFPSFYLPVDVQPKWLENYSL